MLGQPKARQGPHTDDVPDSPPSSCRAVCDHSQTIALGSTCQGFTKRLVTFTGSETSSISTQAFVPSKLSGLRSEQGNPVYSARLYARSQLLSHVGSRKSPHLERRHAAVIHDVVQIFVDSV